MAIRTLLKFRNLDLSKDINDRYTGLFVPGFFEGGTLVPVSGQLKVDIQAPWKLISKEGMVIEETSDNTRLAITSGQKTIVAVKVVYQENNEPIVEIAAIEQSAFELLADKDYYVIFALIDVPAGASLMLSSYIHYAERDIVDKLGRLPLRGIVTNYTALPVAKDNIAGDLYVVADGIGGIPHIYGWSEEAWIILTDAATVTADLAAHRGTSHGGLPPIFPNGSFTNERHLSDDEKNAITDTGNLRTSGYAPSESNPFVDNSDPRIPTQNENHALQGTDGSPGDSNRYITEEYPWAVPEEISAITPTIGSIAVLVASSYGPFFIGKGSSSSPAKAASYFKFYDSTLNREYTTSTSHPVYPSVAVNITGLYKNAACTYPSQLIDPVVDADIDGFYTGNLYIKWDIIPDTTYRIIYAKKELMSRVPYGSAFSHPFPDAILRLRANEAQVPASVIKAIEDIKGRDFDDVPPISEQNTHLKGSVIGTKEYIGAVFKSDNVLGDFRSVEGIPVFGNDFLTNIGIPQDYSFENTSLVQISYVYDTTTGIGTVTYGSTVDLSSVIAGQDVFIDGSLIEYKIITKATNSITIQKRNGKAPRSINTSICLTGILTNGSKIVTSISPTTSGLFTSMAIKGNANIPVGTLVSSVDSVTQLTLSNAATLDSNPAYFLAVPNTQTINFYHRGSIKKDNNPRQINLATLDYLFGKDRILSRQIQMIPNEFHPTTGNVAFEIISPLHSATFREPRVRFYGGFKNRESGNRSRVAVTGTGSIMVTGFFTDLFLLMDVKNPAPVLSVYVDGGTVTTPTIPTAADANGFENELDMQHQYFKINSTALSDLVPHTVEIYITGNTDDFIIYGFDLIRNTVSNVALLPGRAFVQSDLFQKNTLDYSITPPRGGYGSSMIRGRGLVNTRYINRQLVEAVQTTAMLDMDGDDVVGGCPKGTVTNGTPIFTPSQGLTKFSYYQIGDIVKLSLSAGGYAVQEQIFYVSSITGSAATFSTNIVTDGPQRIATLIHVASTVGDCFDTLKEFNKYFFADMGIKQLADFAYLVQYGTAGNKHFTLEDGTTTVSATGTVGVKYVNTGIDGADIALNMVDNTSKLRIRAVASQIDLLVVSTSAISGALVSIDGSPSFAMNFTGNGLNRATLFTNARYQTHEVLITNASGLDVVGFIVYEPTHSVKIEGSLLATQHVIANYDSSYSYDGTIVPTGAIAIDPYKMGGSFINVSGNDWTTSLDFTNNQWWGRYNYTTITGAYFEYTFLGCGFEAEYISDTKRQIGSVYINGTLATPANFGTATFKNMSVGLVDMYNSGGLARKKFGVSGLTFGLYTIKISNSGTANPSAGTPYTGINICTFYEINYNGYMSYSPSKGFRGTTGVDNFVYGLDWVRDERTFDSGFAVKEELPNKTKINAQSVSLQDIKTDKITLTSGTSCPVVFPVPFTDTDYIISYYVINPSVTTVVMCSPSSISVTGFTANFSVALASGTLIYTATKYL